jgi:hypothetical protein
MGHSRLGNPPKSQKWDQVVAAIVGEDDAGTTAPASDVGEIARLALEAAEKGLETALLDEGLRHTFYTLTQIVLAARQEDWKTRLDAIGVKVPEDGNLLQFTSAVQDSIDDRILSQGKSTDISEMAQQSAGEALASLTEGSATSLFGGGEEQLNKALRELSTRDGFGKLGQRFFGRFMARFLNFYLSRITSGAVGRSKLPQISDLSAFNESLTTHCDQSARIVRDFCGQWYSKTNYEQGITPTNVTRFMAVALKKLQKELQLQRGEP